MAIRGGSRGVRWVRTNLPSQWKRIFSSNSCRNGADLVTLLGQRRPPPEGVTTRKRSSDFFGQENETPQGKPGSATVSMSLAVWPRSSYLSRLCFIISHYHKSGISRSYIAIETLENEQLLVALESLLEWHCCIILHWKCLSPVGSNFQQSSRYSYMRWREMV